MNYCVFNGYVEQKFAYNQDEEKKFKFDFFVSVENDDGIARPIPFRAYGDMAVELYAKLQIGYYVEITSKFIRLAYNKNYFVVKDLTYKAPKSEKQYYVKSSQLLEMYNPSDILEKVKKNGK